MATWRVLVLHPVMSFINEMHFTFGVDRSELLTEQPKEYRFGGDGYVVMDKVIRPVSFKILTAKL